MPISPLNLRWLTEPHDLQGIPDLKGLGISGQIRGECYHRKNETVLSSDENFQLTTVAPVKAVMSGYRDDRSA